MSSGMKKIAVGLLFLSVHITIGKLVIFPPVVGAAFLLWGIHDFAGKNSQTRLAVFGLAGGCYNRSLQFLEVSRKGVYGSMDFGGSCPSGVWSVLVSVYQIGNGEKLVWRLQPQTVFLQHSDDYRNYQIYQGGSVLDAEWPVFFSSSDVGSKGIFAVCSHSGGRRTVKREGTWYGFRLKCPYYCREQKQGR